MCAVCIRLGVLDGCQSAVCILNEVCSMYRVVVKLLRGDKFVVC